jgi:hypothetical protein
LNVRERASRLIFAKTIPRTKAIFCAPWPDYYFYRKNKQTQFSPEKFSHRIFHFQRRGGTAIPIIWFRTGRWQGFLRVTSDDPAMAVMCLPLFQRGHVGSASSQPRPARPAEILARVNEKLVFHIRLVEHFGVNATLVEIGAYRAPDQNDCRQLAETA